MWHELFFTTYLSWRTLVRFHVKVLNLCVDLPTRWVIVGLFIILSISWLLHFLRSPLFVRVFVFPHVELSGPPCWRVSVEGLIRCSLWSDLPQISLLSLQAGSQPGGGLP